ncbi:CD99 antigen isoform 2-T2 [Geothlypis trichas]
MDPCHLLGCLRVKNRDPSHVPFPGGCVCLAACGSCCGGAWLPSPAAFCCCLGLFHCTLTHTLPAGTPRVPCSSCGVSAASPAPRAEPTLAIPAACPRFLLPPLFAIPSIHHYCVRALINLIGQDEFSLEDALLGESTKKPLVTQKTPSSNKDDFDLSDAFDFGDPKPHPPANPRDTDNPKKDQPKDSDKFDDSDLVDGSFPRGGGSDGSGSNERKGPAPNSDQESEGSQGVLAGIISAVGATVVASVGSFIAYQKKKLCFKQSDEENVNMDSHRGAQSEPPVQRTLLEN